MKAITIRDLRQRWPETERTLEAEKELIITRDGKPVAKLVRLVAEEPRRQRWDPHQHMRWIKKVWGKKVFPSADEALGRDRAERWEAGSA